MARPPRPWAFSQTTPAPVPSGLSDFLDQIKSPGTAFASSRGGIGESTATLSARPAFCAAIAMADPVVPTCNQLIDSERGGVSPTSRCPVPT